MMHSLTMTRFILLLIVAGLVVTEARPSGEGKGHGKGKGMGFDKIKKESLAYEEEYEGLGRERFEKAQKLEKELDDKAAEILGMENNGTHQVDQDEINLFDDEKHTPEELEEMLEEMSNENITRRGSIDQRKIWDRTIYYQIDMETTWEDVELNNIRGAIKHWQDHTCLTFEENIPETGAYMLIERKEEGCWSYVGKLWETGRQPINLAIGCAWDIGTPMHEIMHFLGSSHEQSRQDRDEYVKIITENIMNGHAHNFLKVESPSSNLGVKYDYGSVMHYSNFAFSANGNPTIECKSADTVKCNTMGSRSEASFYDYKLINLAYNCSDCPDLTCKNGGYPDPNSNCQKCVCPPGLQVPVCDESPCEKTRLGPDYKGDIAVSASGLRCLSWSVMVMLSISPSWEDWQFPDGSLAEAKNKCRNPDFDAHAWCYVDSPQYWEYCDTLC